MPVTSTELGRPSSLRARCRFFASASACRWLTNKPSRSAPSLTDQPYSVGSTEKTVVTCALTTTHRSTRAANPRAGPVPLVLERAGQMLLVFLHHQRAGGSTHKRYLASGPAPIPIVLADEGHLVDVHPNFGTVRSR